MGGWKMADILDFNNQRHIDDETKAIMAEGRRRLKDYEGIPQVFPPDGKMIVGTHKQPSIEEVEEFWGGEPAITTHTPTLADIEGLANEVNDLERDVELLRKWSGVEYDYE